VTVTEADGFVMVGDERVDLPVEVRSAQMVAATYAVPADAAQRIVAPTGLRVVRQRGRAFLALSAVRYADNDLGPYNEVAVAFVVEPHDLAPGTKPAAFTGQVTTYIHRLPVNQAFTCEAGRGIWGFPKWVADIDYDNDGRRTTVVLRDEGQVVLSLGVRSSPLPIPSRRTEMSSYSFTDGVLRRTPWVTGSERATGRPSGVQVALGHGHPMAEELRSLGLPRRALFSMTTGNMRASFGLPETIPTGLAAATVDG
jgi:hypothetical protein